MLRNTKTTKNGQCKTILERWHKDAKYRDNLSEHGWTEEQIRQHEALALEHLKNDTKNRRSGTSLKKKEEGKRGPMRQRRGFREAKHTYRQLCKEHVESTGEGISSVHPTHQARHHR